MQSESDASKNISNETICGYFYIMFIVSAVLAGIVLLADIYTFTTVGARAGLILMLRSAPTIVLAVLNSLFMYAICSRSLLRK